MSRERVLIADDDPVAVNQMAAVIEQAGFETLTATDANQAFTLAIRQEPACILLDIQMPGGTGLTVLQRLRKFGKTRFIPVIVVSGTSDPDVPGRVTELGAQAFVPKPIEPKALQTLLRQLIAERASPPVDAVPNSERDCPFCAEPIKARAKLCKHCGSTVEPLA